MEKWSFGLGQPSSRIITTPPIFVISSSKGFMGEDKGLGGLSRQVIALQRLADLTYLWILISFVRQVVLVVAGR